MCIDSSRAHVRNWKLILLWGFVFICGVLFVVASIICESLPDDNVLYLNSISVEFVSGCVSVVLVVVNTFVIPKLIDAFGIHSQSRPYIVVFLRSLVTIFIPFIAGLLLLQHCFRCWTQFWNPCRNNESQFDIIADVNGKFPIYDVFNLKTSIFFLLPIFVLLKRFHRSLLSRA